MQRDNNFLRFEDEFKWQVGGRLFMKGIKAMESNQGPLANKILFSDIDGTCMHDPKVDAGRSLTAVSAYVCANAVLL
eukprot:786836-Pelagomonas_calceolata.AAC.3